MKETRTIKIRTDDYRALKVLAAERGITMLDLISQVVQKERDTKMYTEQDVRAAWSAQQTNRQAASQECSAEELIRATSYGEEDGGVGLEAELAFYRSGAAILESARIVSTDPFDATLAGSLSYEQIERKNPISPIIRAFAGYVATSERHRYVALVRRGSAE